MPEQDAYSFALACIWMGGQNAEALLANYESLSSRWRLR